MIMERNEDGLKSIKLNIEALQTMGEKQWRNTIIKSKAVKERMKEEGKVK